MRYDGELIKGSSFVKVKVYNQDNLVGTYIYNVRQPYCAFLEATYKPNLVIPVHGMFMRKSSGLMSAELEFTILPNRLMSGGAHSFKITSFDASGKTTSLVQRPQDRDHLVQRPQ